MRGKHSQLEAVTVVLGLIPACAGKTCEHHSRTSQERAHPRVCGENMRTASASAEKPGSSPRVRGKLRSTMFDTVATGLIPACAGKTQGASRLAATPWAHPRVCGENGTRCEDTERTQGSSPRVRGKRSASHAETVIPGLIPACAGKTNTIQFVDSGNAAHPRVCGENAATVFPTLGGGGSSPRVRGKLNMLTALINGLRLIPACAGKTTH